METAVLDVIDWIVIGCFVALVMGVGIYFTGRAGSDISSFFVSGRKLVWYVSGVSLMATSFASDTPLWVASLIRKYGIYYIWQYWSPLIGGALAVALFARMLRRIGIITDVELIECRYSGSSAAALRFFGGFSGAVFLCPMIIGWVTKAMETTAREAMGLDPQYQMITTMMVVLVAVVMCSFSGLWGVVYTDFLQFIISTAGTLFLAFLAVRQVGGLETMVEKLSAMKDWPGHQLNINPSIGLGETQMSVWNAIGYFGLLWWGCSLCGGWIAQRLFACKNARHSTYAMLLHVVVYFGILAWPWIIVALCSMILFPDLGAGVNDDAAYPRMIVTLLPVGFRGILIAAMLAAFISTVSTIFNWGSSYLVNDVYKRFFVRNAGDRHYVTVSRIATVLLGVAGGVISFFATDIQQLLTIFYVATTGLMIISALRWFWWRLNAAGELAGTIASWVISALMIFARVFDRPVQALFDTDMLLSSDPNLLGARMLFVTVAVTLIAIIVSLLTKPTSEEKLEEFIRRAKPLHFFWKPVIARMGGDYHEPEKFGRTCLSWLLAAVCIFSVLYGIGKLLLCEYLTGLAWLVVFAITLTLTIRRVEQDFPRESSE